MLHFKLNQKLCFCSSIFRVKLAWNTYREIVCGNLTLIFNLVMYIVKSSTVFIHLNWDDCMHIQIAKDIVTSSTVSIPLPVH